MAEKLNFKRILFRKGEQKTFLNFLLQRLSIHDAAGICKVSERTIRDWRRGRFLITDNALRILCKRANLSIPRNIRFVDRYWYVKKGAVLGWETVIRKYGKMPKNEEYRKKQWFEWWEREGKHKFHPIINRPKPIAYPKYSEELAEFVGIVLGDGGIADYQITVTLNSADEQEYASFIIHLMRNLFRVPVVVSYRKNSLSMDLIISRVALIRFCIEKLGLSKGNKIKHQVDIPAWIRKNQKYALACVRGLIDTDGSVFTHRYKVNGKLYSYKKLEFCSRSGPLRYSVCRILADFNIRGRLSRGYDVFVDDQQQVKRYFQIVGSHNPKHLMRYKN